VAAHRRQDRRDLRHAAKPSRLPRLLQKRLPQAIRKVLHLPAVSNNLIDFHLKKGLDYLDTSLLVAALTKEAETEQMQHWLSNQRDLAVSDWVATEFSSALSIKLCAGHIQMDDRASALAMFTRLAADSFTVLRVPRSAFRTAARLADHHALGLRAGDALHLAICVDYGATLCTLDRRLRDAGLAVGIKTMLL
jgi:predicted nucleic acid-binding protein